MLKSIYERLARNRFHDGGCASVVLVLFAVIGCTNTAVPTQESEQESYFSPSRQYNFGVMYANGQGVVKDEAEAVRWFRKAAEQGTAGAQHNLGFMYENGYGVKKDKVEAVRWYLLAADQGGEESKEAVKRLVVK